MQLNENDRMILLEKLKEGFYYETEEEIIRKYKTLLGTILLVIDDDSIVPKLYIHEINGIAVEIGISIIETGFKISYVTKNAPSVITDDMKY